MTEGLREKIEDIFKSWYKTYGFELPKDGCKEIVDAILSALLESLPGEITKEYAEKTAAPHYFVDGWNSCLSAVRKIVRGEE